MGMIDEVLASMEAKRLEKVMLEAKNTNNKDIINFVKKFIYPMYLSACGEAWEKPSLNEDLEVL